jgi:hypothetical protein
MTSLFRRKEATAQRRLRVRNEGVGLSWLHSPIDCIASRDLFMVAEQVPPSGFNFLAVYICLL